MLHFFSKVDKMNSDVVQKCLFKRLCKDHGFTVHDSLLVYRAYVLFAVPVV